MKRFIVFISIALCSLSLSAGEKTKTIDPVNPAIHFGGRTDLSISGQISYDWPGVYFECRFTGKTMGLKLYGNKQIYYQVFVDNTSSVVESAQEGEIIWVAQNLKPGNHTLKVVKRTEAFLGVSVFKGLVIDFDATILPVETKHTRKIEFIGNSITCGYGTEGKDKYEHFKPETENNYTSYAAYLSRAFNADYQIEAHSGMGIVRHYGDSIKVSVNPQMPVRFGQTMDNDQRQTWDFNRWKPDMIIINLGTNDFSTMPYPDKVVFQRTYEGLITHIRQVYGNIHVFCIVGPMIGEPCYGYVKEMVENFSILYKDDHVHFIGLPLELTAGNGDLGSDYHPSSQGQKKMATMIAPVISGLMEWDYKME